MENAIEKFKNDNLCINVVSVNIVNSVGMIFNKNWTPILFIQDRGTNIVELFNKDVKFRNHIANLLKISTSYYFDLSLYYYIYEIADGKERHTDASVEINKVWTVKDLSELGDDNENIPLSLLFIDNAINDILEKINSPIQIHTSEKSLDSIFSGIDEIKEYRKSRFTNDLLFHSVRSYLLKNNTLKRDDLKFIMDTFKKILDEYNKNT